MILLTDAPLLRVRRWREWNDDCPPYYHHSPPPHHHFYPSPPYWSPPPQQPAQNYYYQYNEPATQLPPAPAETAASSKGASQPNLASSANEKHDVQLQNLNDATSKAEDKNESSKPCDGCSKSNSAISNAESDSGSAIAIAVSRNKG